MNGFLNICFNEILTESQESDSQHKARQLCKERGVDENTVYQVRDKIISLRDKKIAKFTLGCVRMELDGEFNNIDDDTITDLNKILKLIAYEINDKYDKNLNNLSLNDLIEQFEPIIREREQTEKNNVKNLGDKSDNYYIKRIDSFEESTNYEEYTNPNSRWCLTYDERMWKNYTKSGNRTVYFCLRNDISINDNPTQGVNCPKDEYGLSMICVIVDKFGKLTTSTCRWNHDNGGDDSILSVEEISKLLNVDFYKVFKPNLEKINKRMEEIKILLNRNNTDELNKEGIRLENINDKYRNIYMEDYGCNIIDENNNFVLSDWHDSIEGDFYKWRFLIVHDNKDYYMDENFNILGDGFYQCSPFNKYDKYAIVIREENNLENLYFNVVDENINLVFDRWFNNIHNVNRSRTIIAINDEKSGYLYNIDEKRKITKDYEEIEHHYSTDAIIVKENSRYKFINEKGESLTKLYRQIKRPDLYGILYCGINDDFKIELISYTGKVIEDNIVDMSNLTYNIIVYKKRDDKFNFIDTSICEKLLDTPCYSYKALRNNKFIAIRFNKSDKYYNIIDLDGNICDVECNATLFMKDEYGDDCFLLLIKDLQEFKILKVKDNDLVHIEYDEWLDYNECFMNNPKKIINGCLKIIKNGKYNFINTSGYIVSKNLWFDYADNFTDEGIAKVKIMDKEYYVSRAGILYDSNKKRISE